MRQALFIDTVFMSAGIAFNRGLRRLKPGKSLKAGRDPPAVPHCTMAPIAADASLFSTKCRQILHI
jgi:hypothetical protein